MARVEIPAPGDLIMDSAGNVRVGVSVSLTLAGTGTNVTHYSALTAGTSTTGGLVSGVAGDVVDGSGNRRYIDDGIPTDMTISGRTKRLEPTSSGAVAGLSNVESFIGLTASVTAAIEAAIVDATAANTRAGVVHFGQGRVYTLTTRAVRLDPSYIGLELRLNGCTITTSSATKGRAFDLWRTADYQTFQNITLAGPGTVDGANVTDAANQHCVLGNLIDGAWGQRVNVSNVTVKDIKATNVTTATGAENRQVVSIASAHLAGGETLTTLQDILVQDCDFAHGGNVGVGVLGTGAATVNVFCDRITVRRCKMDSGVVPTAFHVAAAIQIGGNGFGGKYTIDECTGANSADVGIELDAPQTAVVTNTTMTDCLNAEFFCRNFNSPAQPQTQVVTFRNCEAKLVSMNPVISTTPGNGFILSAASAATFGHVILEGCTYRAATANLQVSGGAILGTGPISRITIRDFQLAAESINYSPGSGQTPSMINLRSAAACRVLIDGLHMKLAGTINANVTPTWMHLSGGTGAMVVDVQNVTAEGNLAGASAGFNTIMSVGEFTGTLSGRIRAFRLLSWAGGDTTPKRIKIAGTGTLTIATRLHIEECDFLSSLGGFEINFVDATNRPKVSMGQGMIWGSNIGNPPTVASAATLTLPAIDSVLISGNTGPVTAITALPPDTVISMKFASTPTITAGASIKLAGGANFVATADDTLTLMCDGTNWWQVGSSVNA